jgi:hypothetical protein
MNIHCVHSKEIDRYNYRYSKMTAAHCFLPLPFSGLPAETDGQNPEYVSFLQFGGLSASFSSADDGEKKTCPILPGVTPYVLVPVMGAQCPTE